MKSLYQKTKVKLGISKQNTVVQQPKSAEKFLENTSEATQNIHQDKLLAGGVSTESPAEGTIEKENSRDESLKGMNTMSGPLSAAGKYFYYRQNKGH